MLTCYFVCHTCTLKKRRPVCAEYLMIKVTTFTWSQNERINDVYKQYPENNELEQHPMGSQLSEYEMIL